MHFFESAWRQLHEFGSPCLLLISLILRFENKALSRGSTEYSLFCSHTVTKSQLLPLFLWADWFFLQRFQCFIVSRLTNFVEFAQMLSVLKTQSIRLYDRLFCSIEWLFGRMQAIRCIKRDSVTVGEHVRLESLLLSLSVKPQPQLQVRNVRHVQLRETSDLFIDWDGWSAFITH